jgi:hypothetical protein
LFAKVVGTITSIAEIGEQIAWVGASLRSSPFKTGICACRPVLKYERLHKTDAFVDHTASSKIEFVMESVDGEGDTLNGRCWYGLFKNPVVVCGFPIPRRSTIDTGLELPLTMMMRLAGAKRVTFFDTRLVIKGYSTLLVPMRRCDGMIIWHLIYDKQGKRISYLSDTVDHGVHIGNSDLYSCRHILGWCSDAKTFAGKC